MTQDNRRQAIALYHKTSNEDAFQFLLSSLYEKEITTLVDIVTKHLDNGKLTARKLKHLVRVLTLSHRHNEAIYYCAKYHEKFDGDKEINRSYALSLIYAGWLGESLSYLQSDVKFGDPPSYKQALLVAAYLKCGQIEKAVTNAIALTSMDFPKNKVEFLLESAINTAIVSKNYQLILALIDLSHKRKFQLSKKVEKEFREVLLCHLASVLWSHHA